ncbi:histidine phosphatase family protein [Brevibacillus sp. SYP-B805]|uniref:histidine phosphatase family protein n=1 Tax=Brevibacillus sp. SYP-B805 TaxID=1578199 RepID=UPI0013ED9422|nr:histidine phosphatase family protein [Brevibacillus sp. SYP-B805]
MKQLYVIRHCKAAGQEPDAPLTPEGMAQAQELADFFQGMAIDQIITSPFLRARQSIQPLTDQKRLPLIMDDRLAERVLAEGDLPDWLERLRESFDDLDLCWAGGESSRTAMNRAAAVAEEVMRGAAPVTLLVTHGCLMTLLLKHFDDSFGFAEWQRLTNPDVYVVTVDGENCSVKRVWREGTR